MKKRLLCLFLTLALLVTVLLPAVPAAQASTKAEKTKAIGIVFDNSGSMYTGSNTSGWCRATYATEAFASMMNEGDQLQIYPMSEITLDGTNQSYSMDSPLVIHGPEEASAIRKIFTNEPWDTPFSTVDKAYAGLMQTKADEKYLVILTDGKFEEGNKVEDMDHVNNTLAQYCNDVQVMYLGLNVKNE